MSNWLAWLRDIAPHEPATMISVLATEGSAPRDAGTRMLVTGDAIHGTIGGGQLEFRAVEQARKMLLLARGTWRVQDYPLGPLLGQCCGGRVRLLIEHVDPDALAWLNQATPERMILTTLTAGRVERNVCNDTDRLSVSARGDPPRVGARFVDIAEEYRRPLYLFGAGHVGQAIARHAHNLPFRLAWFDTRPVFDSVEQVCVVPESSISNCVADAPSDAAILILTHDHALDYTIVKAALDRPAVAFLGLIGSATKRTRFLSRLERSGSDADALARLTSPIGIAGVVGKSPDVIAIAVLAQLLQLAAAS